MRAVNNLAYREKKSRQVERNQNKEGNCQDVLFHKDRLEDAAGSKEVTLRLPTVSLNISP